MSRLKGSIGAWARRRSSGDPLPAPSPIWGSLQAYLDRIRFSARQSDLPRKCLIFLLRGKAPHIFSGGVARLFTKNPSSYATHFAITIPAASIERTRMLCRKSKNHTSSRYIQAGLGKEAESAELATTTLFAAILSLYWRPPPFLCTIRGESATDGSRCNNLDLRGLRHNMRQTLCHRILKCAL
jgi:hypothetical protein